MAERKVHIDGEVWTYVVASDGTVWIRDPGRFKWPGVSPFDITGQNEDDWFGWCDCGQCYELCCNEMQAEIDEAYDLPSHPPVKPQDVKDYIEANVVRN